MNRCRVGHWLLLVYVFAGCPARSVVEAPINTSTNRCKPYPQTLEKDVDILFVIDNSESMAEEQENLRKNFPKLIDALRSPTLDNNIPNVRIGVISTDLGAGNYAHPSCERQGGDGGRLIDKSPQGLECPRPNASYIEHLDGKTNVIGSASADPVQQVKDAFACLANLGTGGCGYEHQLEAAKRALDPNVNPHFLRPDALLAIVWITDEDDCSAQDTLLFDPASQTTRDQFGPLSSFRCTEFGIDCDGSEKIRQRNDINGVTYQNCRPADRKDHHYLYRVSDYIDYFKGLKPPNRVILAAIAGPTEPFTVKILPVEGDLQPRLQPSCTSKVTGDATPAVRIKAALQSDQQLSENSIFYSICEPDYTPAMQRIAKRIIANLGGQCLPAPLLTQTTGALACVAGTKVGTTSSGQTIRCDKTCLSDIDCVVEEGIRGTNGKTLVDKCPKALFENLNTVDCGTTCPCWRVIPKTADTQGDPCDPNHPDETFRADTPYGFQILRKHPTPKGTEATLCCNASEHRWGTKGLADLAAKHLCQ